jgi:hypothetical protein
VSGKGVSGKGAAGKGAAGKGAAGKGAAGKGAAGKGAAGKGTPAKRAPTATPAGAAHMKAPRRSPAGDKAPRRSPVRRVSASRGSRRPTSTRPGDRRAHRVRQALARLDVGRLLPADQEARARRSLRLRRIGFRLAAAALALVVVYGVFPVRTWINQRAAEERARERQEVFDREIDLLEDEVRDLGRDERIEEEARELDFVLPGEESYRILPAPDAPPAGSTTTTTSTTEPPATAPER